MKLSKTTIAIFILALFIVTAFFGSRLIMMTDAQGHMAPCPFMSGSGSLCNMNALQHINAWQSLFVATTPIVILLFLMLSLLFAAFPREALEKDDLAKTASSIFKNAHLDSLVFNPLRIALSKGILHPKRYNRIAIS